MFRLLLHNDKIADVSESVLRPGQVGTLSGWGVFSTIRVSNGRLFAFERHFARMKRDAALVRIPFPADANWLESRLLSLVEANQAPDATLRVAIIRNKGGIWEAPGIDREFDLVALMTALKDWGTGVKLDVAPQARHAESKFAGTKVLSWAFNLTLYEQAQESGFDEVVLLNERDEVSECTSANIFVSRGNQVWTPPLTSGCLPGITRELLLTDVKVEGIQVSEKTLLLEDLETADEVFITSTTRDLLPVIEIAGLRIQQRGTSRAALQTAFSQYIREYSGLRIASSVR
ncbi:MAG TPA: aminotransferase class IV [Bryobacteraceae bacterium]|nr:aminotransferase class IV [Bryobacteraceae bacterium]